MKKIIVVLVSLLIVSCQSDKKIEEKPFDTLTSLIDQYATETLKSGSINSIALAVYKDGEIYHNYFGEIDKNAKNLPNDDTLFEIASISKTFAGSLAAKAVLEKKIALEDDIRKYLKDDYPNLAYENTPITIKNLLTHTLGLKNRTPKHLDEVYDKIGNGYYQNKPLDYNISDLLEELKTVELDKKPGTVYVYNSLGPELVAYILEQVYGKEYKELLQEFLNELGMKNTYVQSNQKHHKNLANSYNSKGNIAPLGKNPLFGGAYGMITTLPDLIKFMKFQLESENPLIKESTRILFEDDDDNTMGYLWQNIGTGKEEGFYYSKTGTSSGAQSGLLLCPGSKYGLILIVNNNSEESYNDWGRLFFNKIEPDVIKFPKLNLMSVLKPEFLKNLEAGKKQFNTLKNSEEKYFNTSLSRGLNVLGYDFLYSEINTVKAIEVFEFATKEFPENANLYDSLGEAYFTNKNYEKSLLNFKKSLELNPKNENAKKYISKIDELMADR